MKAHPDAGGGQVEFVAEKASQKYFNISRNLGVVISDFFDNSFLL